MQSAAAACSLMQGWLGSSRLQAWQRLRTSKGRTLMLSLMDSSRGQQDNVAGWPSCCTAYRTTTSSVLGDALSFGTATVQ